MVGATASRWRPGTRLRRLAAQAVFLAAVAALVAWFGDNLTGNLRRLGFATGFDFLQQPAGFPIAGSDFPASGTVLEAIRVGVRNTVGLSAVGIVLATVVGFTVGVFRLSPNRLLRRVGSLFVETIRNIPVLVIIVFMFVAVALRLPPIEGAGSPLGIAVLSNRGIWLPAPRDGWMVLFACLALSVLVAAIVVGAMARRGAPRRGVVAGAIVLGGLGAGWVAAGAGFSVPELDGRVVRGGVRLETQMGALLLGLVLYTSSHIAELVRASILSVPRGQTEAAEALGLSAFQRLRLVVVPQALVVMVPPLANQYLNLTKNSSLGVAVGFYELTLVVRTATANASPAPQTISVLMAVYLGLSLLIAAAANLLNRQLTGPRR